MTTIKVKIWCKIAQMCAVKIAKIADHVDPELAVTSVLELKMVVLIKTHKLIKSGQHNQESGLCTEQLDPHRDSHFGPHTN